MGLFKNRKKRVVELGPMPADELLAAFRVPEDAALLRGVLHVLKAHEEEAVAMILPGQPELMRRDYSTMVFVYRELKESLLELVTKANESAKGSDPDT